MGPAEHGLTLLDLHPRAFLSFAHHTLAQHAIITRNEELLGQLYDRLVESPQTVTRPLDADAMDQAGGQLDLI